MQKKNIIILLISCLIFLSFSFFNSNENKTESKKDFKNTQISDNLPEFKLSFFCMCLKEAHEGSAAINEILQNDISQGRDFPLGIHNYRLIDSLAREVNNMILKDSIQRTKYFCSRCDEEEFNRKRTNGLIGKRIMTHCLDYYESEELDSIGRKALSK